MGISTASRFSAALLIALGLAMPAWAAGTDTPSPLSSPLKVKEGHLMAMPDLGPLFDPAGVEALDSGFTTTVLLVFRWEEPHPDGLPVLPIVQLRIRYDVWAEAWWITVGPKGAEQRTRLASREAALQQAASPGPVELVPLDRLPNGVPLAIQVRAVLNPMSAEELARVEEWLRRPEGAGTGVGLVGSMIGFLVDEQSGFSTRSLEGRTARFRREGEAVHAAD